MVWHQQVILRVILDGLAPAGDALGDAQWGCSSGVSTGPPAGYAPVGMMGPAMCLAHTLHGHHAAPWVLSLSKNWWDTRHCCFTLWIWVMQKLLKIQLNFDSFDLKLCGQGREYGKEKVVLLLS